MNNAETIHASSDVTFQREFGDRKDNGASGVPHIDTSMSHGTSIPAHSNSTKLSNKRDGGQIAIEERSPLSVISDNEAEKDGKDMILVTQNGDVEADTSNNLDVESYQLFEETGDQLPLPTAVHATQENIHHTREINDSASSCSPDSSTCSGDSSSGQQAVETERHDGTTGDVPTSVEYGLRREEDWGPIFSSIESLPGWKAPGLEGFEETQAHLTKKEWDSDVLVALERFHLGNFREALQLFQLALQWRVAELGTDHEHVSLIREKLGDISVKMGMHQDAELFYDLAVRHLRTKIGSINKDVARILASQGDLYRKMGEHSLALKRYKESLFIRRKLLAVEKSVARARIRTSHGTHNAGMAKRGSFESASSLFSVVITGDGDADAKDAVPYVLNSIGNLQFRQGEYSQAIKNYKKSLKGHMDLGETHQREICGTLSNLGKAYFENKDYDKAIACLKAAVRKFFLSDLPARELEVAMLWTKIGSAHFWKKNYEMATKYYMKSLEAKRAVIKDESHPEILLTRHDTALVLCKQGRFDDAMKILEDIKLRKIEAGNANGVDYAKLLIDMSAIHANLGGPEALDRAEKLCASARQMLLKAKLPGWHCYSRELQHLFKKINHTRSTQAALCA